MIDIFFLFTLYFSITYWIFRKYPKDILKNSIKIPIFISILFPMLIFFMFLKYSPDKIEKIFYKFFGFKSGDILRIAMGLLIWIPFFNFFNIYIGFLIYLIIMEILIRIDNDRFTQSHNSL